MTKRARILRAATGARALTLRELAALSGLDLSSTRCAVRELRRDRLLCVVGTRRAAHARRPVALYALAQVDTGPGPLARLWAVWWPASAAPVLA